MSLDNIQLTPLAVQGLFRKTLVALKSHQPPTTSNEAATLAILGKNLQQITIVVNHPNSAFIEDEELNFLLGILAACKLNMEDVGILNLAKNKSADYTAITRQLHAKTILLFGCNVDQIGLPLSFPDYQIQQYDSQTYLQAPPLAALQHDKAEKMKLWGCLKQIFSI